MNREISIPQQLYSRLERLAKGFDTPANVIERLLDHYEGTAEPEESPEPDTTDRSRDTTKYDFNGEQYGKGRLVLAVIRQYVAEIPGITLEKLKTAFPKQLQGSIGVFNELSAVQKKYAGKNHMRHFVKPGEVVKLKDCTIAVSTEWGAGNFPAFLQQAEKLGFEIAPVAD